MVSNIHSPDGGFFGFTVLGSGSAGNATVIHGGDGSILLDAGFSMKELCARMSRSGIAPESIRAVLVTHEHIDHVKGCRVFADTFGIPAYLTASTCAELMRKNFAPERRVLIEPGASFSVCGIDVDPFSVTHDVPDAVDYTFCCRGKKLGYATDLGFLSQLVVSRLHGCDALVLESNYDAKSLAASSRPLHLKRRIMSRHGHLSNDNAREALPLLLNDHTRQLVFAHLSSECNAPALVTDMAKSVLNELNRTDVSFYVAAQDAPLETLWLC